MVQLQGKTSCLARGFDHDELFRKIDETELNRFEVSNGENVDFQYKYGVTEESSN